jgi:hypothetical protein
MRRMIVLTVLPRTAPMVPSATDRLLYDPSHPVTVTLRARVLARTVAVLALAVLVLAVLLGVPAPLRAQSGQREATLDVRPWSVDAAIAWRSAPGHLWGFSVGGGADDFTRTFRPEVVDTSSEYVTLEQIIRMGPFYRYEHDGRFSADIGLRVGIGGVRGISGSPGLVTGAHAALFYGGRHVRIGPRLFVGAAREAGRTESVIHVDWLTARLRLPF